MEDKLISVKKLKAYYAWVRVKKSGQEFADTLDAIIDAQPAVGSRHGKWIFKQFDGDSYWVCTECGKEVLYSFYGEAEKTPFCPHCGAKMESEEKNEQKTY
jgi:rubrerythrin